jgi:uncharacterized membrane protein YhaH (DUF805 family)
MPIIENWKLVVLERYAKFDGRAGRAEFWWYFLANVIIWIVLLMLTQASGIFLVLYFLFMIAMFVPNLAVGVRRLHDTDKSGLLLLLAVIPVVGSIILLVLFAMEGTNGPNQYGAAAEPAAA